MTKPLRVVVNARLRDGASGGVQQWVIGLAAALSKLDADTEEYLFLVDPSHAQWLEPYLGRRCRMLVRRRPPLLRRIARRARRPARGIRRSLVTAISRRRDASVSPAVVALKPSVPRSDGTIEKARADVVHFPFQEAFLTAVPSIFQPWDLQHLHLPEFFTTSQWEGRELTYRAFCQQSTLVVAPSRWVRQDLIDQYGLAPDRIAVVNVPPATAAYADPTPQEMQSIAQRLELPDRFIYYPAQAWPHKNHNRLLEALGQLRTQGLTVPLVCTGRLNQRHEELVRLADGLGLAQDVRFLGYLEPTDIQVLYRRATALVFPSLYEGWGLPIVEAFSSGLPVACSNVTSLPELVNDAALVFDPYDPEDIAAAIRRLWTDDVLAAELSERGREAVGRYDWRQTALIMRAHYRRVAGLPLGAVDAALCARTALV